jgi:hypothetical protein
MSEWTAAGMWVAIGYLSGIALKTMLHIWRSRCENEETIARPFLHLFSYTQHMEDSGTSLRRSEDATRTSKVRHSSPPFKSAIQVRHSSPPFKSAIKSSNSDFVVL